MMRRSERQSLAVLRLQASLVRRSLMAGARLLTIGLAFSTFAAGEEPSFVRDVQPLLRKYCGGCHNEADKEGDFSVASFASLIKGTPDGVVIEPSSVEKSRLFAMLGGTAEPRMPPEDEAQPTVAEIDRLKAWVAA